MGLLMMTVNRVVGEPFCLDHRDVSLDVRSPADTHFLLQVRSGLGSRTHRLVWLHILLHFNWVSNLPVLGHRVLSFR